MVSRHRHIWQPYAIAPNESVAAMSGVRSGRRPQLWLRPLQRWRWRCGNRPCLRMSRCAPVSHRFCLPLCASSTAGQGCWTYGSRISSPSPSGGRRRSDFHLDRDSRCAAVGASNSNSLSGSSSRCSSCTHRLPRFGARCDSADAAAVLDALLVRPSRSTFDAARPARALVFRDLAIGPPRSGEWSYPPSQRACKDRPS